MKHQRTLKCLFMLIGMVPGFLSGQNPEKETSTIRMGVSQIDITPEVPVLMSGYDARKTPSTGVHDSLKATALYFFDGKTGVLLITTDLIGFTGQLIDEFTHKISGKTNIPSTNIIISAVHNHGGPSVKTYEHDVPAANDTYIASLEDKLILIASRAMENPVPFRMGTGKGICKMNINRRAEFADGGIWLGRNPDGPCDHELDVVKFEGADNKMLAVLVNWPCHGTASGQENYEITGDWPGAASRYINREKGQEIPVAITAGASADINPIYGPGNDFSEIEAIGYHVGKEAVKVLNCIVTYPVNTMKLNGTTLTFPGKKACKDQFPQASYEAGPDVNIRLTVLRIGDLILCGVSGELMTEIGLEIKKQSPFSNTMIITHCNGSSGYICTDRSYSEGGYEIKVTRLMPGVEKPLVGKFLEYIYGFQ